MVQQVSVSLIPRPSTLDEVQCVCVFIPFILDIKFVGRTSRGCTKNRHDWQVNIRNIELHLGGTAVLCKN